MKVLKVMFIGHLKYIHTTIFVTITIAKYIHDLSFFRLLQLYCFFLFEFCVTHNITR